MIEPAKHVKIKNFDKIAYTQADFKNENYVPTINEVAFDDVIAEPYEADTVRLYKEGDDGEKIWMGWTDVDSIENNSSLISEERSQRKAEASAKIDAEKQRQADAFDMRTEFEKRATEASNTNTSNINANLSSTQSLSNQNIEGGFNFGVSPLGVMEPSYVTNTRNNNATNDTSSESKSDNGTVDSSILMSGLMGPQTPGYTRGEKSSHVANNVSIVNQVVSKATDSNHLNTDAKIRAGHVADANWIKSQKEAMSNATDLGAGTMSNTNQQSTNPSPLNNTENPTGTLASILTSKVAQKITETKQARQMMNNLSNIQNLNKPNSIEDIMNNVKTTSKNVNKYQDVLKDGYEINKEIKTDSGSIVIAHKDGKDSKIYTYDSNGKLKNNYNVVNEGVSKTEITLATRNDKNIKLFTLDKNNNLASEKTIDFKDISKDGYKVVSAVASNDNVLIVAQDGKESKIYSYDTSGKQIGAIDIDVKSVSDIKYDNKTNDVIVTSTDGKTKTYDANRIQASIKLANDFDGEKHGKYYATDGQKVVETAESAVGTLYDWGGVGEPGRGYDCSGLVSYALTGKHIRLGTTHTFMGWPQTDNPQPGDIVTTDGHCGIYIGDGQMLHAPDFGQPVQVGPVQSGMIYVTYPGR